MAQKILIVEDEENIAQLLHLYLEKEGYETQMAPDGGKAVELFRSFDPDLVLLDIMLPVMDGWSVLKKIREDAYGYIHGHEVGGTNPSLLEALGSTEVNLLLDVGFNREVAGDGALYWKKKEGSLAEVIDKVDQIAGAGRKRLEEKAKGRIIEKYTWKDITQRYEMLFLS